LLEDEKKSLLLVDSRRRMSPHDDADAEDD
jgi:hypothetical protein